MNLMFNGNSLPIGGGFKITDFLEDPVDITTLTCEELYNKIRNNYICFADITYPPAYYGNDYFHKRYVGYIPISGDLIFNLLYPSSGIYLKISTTDLSMHVITLSGSSSDYSHSESSRTLYKGSDKITLPLTDTPMYGKIWVGKFKQIITE